jgi:hypothetical protein
MCILYNQWDVTYTIFFIIISALHVSGGFSAHHQELIKLYVQPWVLSCFPAVYRWCGWVGTVSLCCCPTYVYIGWFSNLQHDQNWQLQPCFDVIDQWAFVFNWNRKDVLTLIDLSQATPHSQFDSAALERLLIQYYHWCMTELHVVLFLLGGSPVSEFYVPTFQNTLSVPSS